MDKSISIFTISRTSENYCKIKTTPIAESKEYIFFDEGIWIAPTFPKKHILEPVSDSRDPETIFVVCETKDEKQALKNLQNFLFDTAMSILRVAYLTEKLNQHLTHENDGN